MLLCSLLSHAAKYVGQSPHVHVGSDGSMSGFDIVDTIGCQRVQSRLIHILHVIMPSLLQPLADRAGDSVDKSGERHQRTARWPSEFGNGAVRMVGDMGNLTTGQASGREWLKNPGKRERESITSTVVSFISIFYSIFYKRRRLLCKRHLGKPLASLTKEPPDPLRGKSYYDDQ
jgi:hypothetical protein